MAMPRVRVVRRIQCANSLKPCVTPIYQAPCFAPTARSIPRRAITTRASSAAAAVPAEPQKPAAQPQVGVKIVPALIAIAVGLAVKFLVPTPDGITDAAWSLFAIFLSTITGLVLEPLPVGAWAFLSLTAVVGTKTLTFAQALSAMTNDVIWLIVISFFFAKGFEKTGLGERIANMFVVALGKSTLGLAYGLVAAETLIAPAMPSTTARAGGIFMPIIKFLSKGQGSEPDSGREKLGAFLVQTQFQASTQSSALFATAAAQNLLCLKLAAELGAPIPDAWMTWFKGAVVPALFGIITIPWMVYKMAPPEIKETPEAPAMARKTLEKMGPMSRDEKITFATILGAVVLWVLGDAIGVPAVLAAMLALCTLLLTGVLSWKDCLTYSPAWDTLTWFAILVSMSSALNASGLISAFAGHVGAALAAAKLHWIAAFSILHTAFFTLHYLFASQTAHVGALYTAFLAMMMAAGVPPVLAAVTLGYNGNLFGSLTHYSSGQSAIYYGSGYMKLSEVFYFGAIMGIRHLLTWGVLGLAWWKFLGWW